MEWINWLYYICGGLMGYLYFNDEKKVKALRKVNELYSNYNTGLLKEKLQLEDKVRELEREKLRIGYWIEIDENSVKHHAGEIIEFAIKHSKK